MPTRPATPVFDEEITDSVLYRYKRTNLRIPSFYFYFSSTDIGNLLVYMPGHFL